MKFLNVLDQGMRCIRCIIENHKKELVLGILMLTLFVAVTAAAVYNSMHIQSTAGVES